MTILTIHDTNSDPPESNQMVHISRAVCESHSRNALIVDYICKDFEAGHVILVECVFLAHLDLLKNLIESANPEIQCSLLSMKTFKDFNLAKASVILASKQAVSILMPTLNPRHVKVSISAFYALGHNVANVANICAMLAESPQSIMRLFMDNNIPYFKSRMLQSIEDLKTFNVTI